MKLTLDTTTKQIFIHMSGGTPMMDDHERVHDLVDELFEKLSHVKDERIDSDAFLDFILLFKNS